MKELSHIKTLEELWTYTKILHSEYFPESKQKPIMAGGKLHKPRYMFVFINPTYRNISSDPNWTGKRRPWTGTKYIWKIFKNAGHLDESLLSEITKRKKWDTTFADKVYSHLTERGFYFTNIVKWTGEDAALPNNDKIKTFLPVLQKEIELVDPEYIVTFGLIPFNALVGEKIKLGDYYDAVNAEGQIKLYKFKLNCKSYNVIPCYFPVGRGNPKRATEILSLLP